MNGVPEKTREEVNAARKAKKEEAKLKKLAATAAKKDAQKQKAAEKAGSTNDAAPKQPKNNAPKQQQNSAPKQQQNNASKQQQKAQSQHKGQGQQKTQNQQQKPQSALKKEEPSCGPKQVRFDLMLSDSEDVSTASTAKSSPVVEVSTASVHPAFLKLAAACDARRLVGVDAICVQFMQAFEEFLTSYEHNHERKVSDDLNQAIRPQLSFLSENGSHPFPLALGNLIRQLKKEINALEDAITETAAKEQILKWLGTFYYENFDAADSAISAFTIEKMRSRRRLLTYSWCPLVERVIIDAAKEFDDLEVVIIDSPADHSAKKMLKNLGDHGINIRYGMLDAIGYVIKEVDMVLLGCTAILSNGHAVSPRGSSLVALTAQAFNIPVLIAAKTYKFVDKVQTFDKSVREKTALMGDKYETIPDDLLTALVTDLRILPASSAPAVLRAKQLAIV
uniref:Translation initiation factor eIF2B subunit delta n=1 Tax=Steinernema glaseri TaxID=37863 RepID=A0A1I7YVI5_9BILA